MLHVINTETNNSYYTELYNNKSNLFPLVLKLPLNDFLLELF
ncbi:Uncharacterised protein [Legionella gratiana]|uniref:Uncharacterized protein n=1 Tax=Legionella gratiana TaxID=45066 RepID=A0A378J4A8_9GAMM|nr:Uncharacterised protein [Legionella gratiana]